MKEVYNVVELFSGIGSQAKALKNIGLKINVQATCEWDIHAFIAYDAIHNNTLLDSTVAELSDDEIFTRLKGYTLSNDGKAAMDSKT